MRLTAATPPKRFTTLLISRIGGIASRVPPAAGGRGSRGAPLTPNYKWGSGAIPGSPCRPQPDRHHARPVPDRPSLHQMVLGAVHLPASAPVRRHHRRRGPADAARDPRRAPAEVQPPQNHLMETRPIGNGPSVVSVRLPPAAGGTPDAMPPIL